VDVTEAMGLALVVGPGWAAAAGRTGGIVHPTRALGIPGAYLWAGRDELPQVLDRLTSAGARRASEDELERLRIAGGVPRWGADMNAKTLPQEAGLDDWAVHYDKGCYLGQEAMAKIHHRGKVNRRLRKLAGEGAWEPGADVRHGDDRVGVITSAANGHALAMLRAGVEAGATVSAAGVDGTVVD
jgi:folate-binding protein YgfZ